MNILGKKTKVVNIIVHFCQMMGTCVKLPYLRTYISAATKLLKSDFQSYPLPKVIFAKYRI